MSAPNTNIETHKKRNRPSLIGIAAAVAIVVLVVFSLGFWNGVPLDEQAAPDVRTEEQ